MWLFMESLDQLLRCEICHHSLEQIDLVYSTLAKLALVRRHKKILICDGSPRIEDPAEMQEVIVSILFFLRRSVKRLAIVRPHRCCHQFLVIEKLLSRHGIECRLFGCGREQDALFWLV